MNYSDCPDFLREYLFYMLTIKGRSPKTVEGYYIDLKNFLKYLFVLKQLRPNKITDEMVAGVSLTDIPLEILKTATLSDVYEYLNFTLNEKKNSAKTRSRKISSIRSLFKYLTVISKKLENNPVKDLETPSLRKSVPKYLTLEESCQLLNAADGEHEARDFCIVTLFLNCGMRLSELVGINKSDIKENQLKILGKGNKERLVYLNNACLEAISQYLQELHKHPIVPKSEKDKDALFLSSRGTRISNRRVEQIIESLLKKSQLDGKGYSVHKLRHTAATLMYQYGHVDIRSLKEVLGHANVGTTEIYTHISNEQIERAIKSSPLSEFHKGSSSPFSTTEPNTEEENE